MIFFRFSTSLSALQSTNYTVAFVLAHAAIGDRPLAAALRLVDAARGSSTSLYSLQLTGSPEIAPSFGRRCRHESEQCAATAAAASTNDCCCDSCLPGAADSGRSGQDWSFRGQKPRTRTPTAGTRQPTRHGARTWAMRETAMAMQTLWLWTIWSNAQCVRPAFC